MPKKIIKVENKKKSSVNLGKIKKVIDDNPQAVKKIAEGIGDLITSSNSKTTTKKNKKSSKKSSSSDVAKSLKTISKLLK